MSEKKRKRQARMVKRWYGWLPADYQLPPPRYQGAGREPGSIDKLALNSNQLREYS